MKDAAAHDSPDMKGRDDDGITGAEESGDTATDEGVFV